ncbi:MULTISPECIES: ATP-binding protein [Streptomyces]|uniref:Histidine kinase-like ATPase domain-containing protein n=1 Tax=Streptomyces melanosporofaciens TaxID=67327 RepID=A0A1H4KS61_STRMJ|nr:ATP-binding protein [Streptomyces melanosporofaciens]SEB61380.1 Histidine kinase-like ATPase domain-containing protein [Streptomyces melanosporofaciens]
MKVCFEISPRDLGENIPDQDAQRVSQMRHLAKACLVYWKLSALTGDVMLLVSELVTNGVKHSCGTEITMTLCTADGGLRLEVSDETSQRPQIQHPDNDAESGRGLQLVQWITQQHGGSWGVSPDGTSTWCSIPLPSPGGDGG